MKVLSSVRRYGMRNTLLGGSFVAGSVIKIDVERVCFAELILNTLLRSVPVYMRCVTRDACGT